MTHFYFFLSIIFSAGFVTILRYFDRNNRNYEKILKASQKLKDEFDKYQDLRIGQVRNVDVDLDNASKRAEALIKELNSTTAHKGSSDNGVLSERVNKLERELEESKKLIADGGNPAGISKNIKNMLKESIKEIKAIKTDIKKIHSDIDLEKKNITKNFEDQNNDIGKRIANYRKELDGFINENWKVFTKQSSNIENDLKRLDEKMQKLRTEHLEEYQTSLINIEEKQLNSMGQLREEYSKLQAEVQKEIEKKIDDYSSYFTRLENRVDEYTKNLDKDLEKNTEMKLLDINKKFTEKVKEIELIIEKSEKDARNNIITSSKDYEKKIAELFGNLKNISTDTDKKMIEYETFIKESSVHIEKLKNDIFTKISDKQKEIDIHLNNAADMGMKLELKVFDGIKDTLNKFKEKVDGSIDQLNIKVDTRVKDTEDKVTKLNNYVEDHYGLIDGKISTLRNGIETLDADSLAFKEKISGNIETAENSYDVFRRETDSKISEIRSSLNENINSIKQESDNSINKINAYFETQKVDTFKKIDDMLISITKDADNKSDLLGQKFSEKFKDIEMKMEDSYNTTLARAKELEIEVENGAEKLHQSFVKMQEELEEKIDMEIEKMKEHLEEKNNTIYHEVSNFEEKLNKSLSDFEDRIYDNSSQINKIEKDYFEKGTNYLNICSEKTAFLNSESVKIKESLELIEKSMKTDIERMIGEGRSLVQETMEKGRLTVEQAYNKLSEDTSKKIGEYKENLSKIKHNLKLIEDKYDTQLEERLAAMDGKFDSKLDILTEKYRTHINEMTNRTDITENDFTRKVQDMESDYNKKTGQLLLESRKQLDELFKSYNQMKDAIIKIESSIETDISESIASGQTILQEKLGIFETDTIKKINEYKSELLSVRQSIDNLSERYEDKFEESVQVLNQKIKDKYIEVNDKYNEHYNELKLRFESLNKDFDGKFAGALKSNNDKFSDFNSKFDLLSNQIEDLKNRIKTEISLSVDKGVEVIHDALNEKIETSKKIFSENEKEFVSEIENYKREFLKIQANMKQTDERFTAKFLDHSNVLDRRISQIENEIKKFEKHTQLFDKTNSLKDKLASEIAGLLDNLEDVKKYKLEIDEIEKKVVKANELALSTDARYTSLLNNSKKIENLEVSLSEIKNFVDDTETRLQKINEARLVINNVEDEIEKVDDKFKKIVRMTEELSKKEAVINSADENIKRLDSSARDIEQKISSIIRKVDDLSFKEETYEKSIRKFEKDASLILQSQDKVMTVIDKFNQVDSLVEDLEVRTQAINKSREWLVKAQTQIENLNAASDKKIKTMQALLDKEEKAGEPSQLKGEDSVKESVFKLKRQGWTIDDIAKTLNRSIGEVELILDLEMTGSK